MTEQKPLTYAEILELLKATIQEREVRFEAMRKRYDEIKQTYNEINPKHSEADKCFSEVKKCRTDMNTLFVKMPQQAAEVRRLLTSLVLNDGTLERNYSKIEEQYSIMQQHNADTKSQKTEINDRVAEVDKKYQKTQQDIADLKSQFGKIVEIKTDPSKFRAAFHKLGYTIHNARKNEFFFNQQTGKKEGEIDVFLEGSEFIILVEEKQNLKPAHVTEHIERLKKYKRYAEGKGDDRPVFGAMCGLDISQEVEKVTMGNGLFLIHLNGKVVEIVTNNKEFTPTAWKHDSVSESNTK